MTSRGHLFIIQRAKDGSPVPVPDPVQNANLIRLRKSIFQDPRLSHDGGEAEHPPPERQQNLNMRVQWLGQHAWLVCLMLALAALTIYLVTRKLMHDLGPVAVASPNGQPERSCDALTIDLHFAICMNSGEWVIQQAITRAKG